VAGVDVDTACHCVWPPPGSPRTATVSFTIQGCTSTDAARRLAEKDCFSHTVISTRRPIVNGWGWSPKD
jgi:selenocysteine lyase/cysteine desulfurase